MDAETATTLAYVIALIFAIGWAIVIAVIFKICGIK